MKKNDKKTKKKKNVQIVKVGFCLEFELAPSESDLSQLQIVFTVTQQKNKLETRLVAKAKKMKCYKRLILEQFVQVSGL